MDMEMDAYIRKAWERIAFDRWLRTGFWPKPLSDKQVATVKAAVEAKFNPYYDPDDGRFTFAPGGSRSGGGGGTRATDRTPSASSPKQPASAGASGPFAGHVRKTGDTGTVARAVNKVITDPKADETIPISGQRVNIRRIGRETVALTIKNGLGNLEATGQFAVTRGKPEITISIQRYKLNSIFATVRSFPSKITIYEHSNGRLAYAIDKDLIVTTFKAKVVDQPKGSYYIKD